jgi:polyisoprenoid-binding protein YceI
MNNKIAIIYYILIITSLFFGCRGPVKEENKSNVPANSEFLGQKYVVDTKKSIVMWKGSMLIGSNNHIGYVDISAGALIIENGQLVGGTAEIDMNTIAEKTHGSDNELVEHLKSPDFFDVEKFPNAAILMTKVVTENGEDITIAANLTVKGITRAIIFPAKMEVKDGVVKVNGKLIIDRTDWGIQYKSGKFYQNLADQAISDSVEFDISIIAKK